MLGKNFSRRHFEIFFLIFLENRIRHFMQIVYLGDNLHEVSDSKKNIVNLSSAESAHSVVSVKQCFKTVVSEELAQHLWAAS